MICELKFKAHTKYVYSAGILKTLLFYLPIKSWKWYLVYCGQVMNLWHIQEMLVAVKPPWLDRQRCLHYVHFFCYKQWKHSTLSTCGQISPKISHLKAKNTKKNSSPNPFFLYSCLLLENCSKWRFTIGVYKNGLTNPLNTLSLQHLSRGFAPQISKVPQNLQRWLWLLDPLGSPVPHPTHPLTQIPASATDSTPPLRISGYTTDVLCAT